MKKREVALRILSLAMSFTMVFTNIPANMIGTVTGSNVGALSNVSAATDYGLADNIQDGTILHCFDWKYKDIEAEIPNIAKAGFTSVQTSPAQKDSSYAQWYMLYQPETFSICTNALGSKEELQSLCKKAEDYGINVIVDVVANHTRAIGDDGLGSDCYHHDEGNIDYGPGSNRYDYTHKRIGMPDLNSESTTVQNKVKAYIQELKSVGVDGIRWDAAKHIGLPSESCNFWPAVTGEGLYNYGEILNGPLNGYGNNDALMKEYTKYICVTDDEYGDGILNAINGGGVPTSIGNYSERGVSKDKLVYWAESHDTYSNNGEYGKATQWIDQNKIDRAYAIVAAQGKATSLYFSRPFQKDKQQIKAGDKGSTHFTSKEVAEVNHFHNAMNGQKEWYVHENNVAAVCRESGAVVVLGSGGNRDVSVTNGGKTVAPGTYTDQVSGSTWTVTETTISGKVGDTGIAVIYNPGPITVEPSTTISKEGGNFSTDTLELTIGLKNATSGTYQIGSEAAKTFTSSTKITIGSGMSYGDSVTIKLNATDGTTTSETKSYTFTKVEQTGNIAYFSLPSGWSEPVYCYAYDSATETVDNGKWPGKQMTKDSATGYYMYELPENIEAPRVIFYSSETNRTPADMEKGYLFSEDGAWLYKDGSWSQYSIPVTKGTVTVKHVDEAGNEIAPSETLQGNVGSAYTTTAAGVEGYAVKETPANASGKYTASAITVTYEYEEVTVDVRPKVTASLASGSTFKTETQEITLTLVNAGSGTYSVDDGPVKSFTGSTKVVLGQGKVADSTVTVKATATSGSTTKEYTFTYNKEFNGTVNEANEVSYASEDLDQASAAAGLASQYKTNVVGFGANKTIAVDGNISDWDSSMLIAQGAANDDPRVYRENSMYEVAVDLYALYGAYDDNNLYLMWEMTNVQDMVAPDDNFPLSQGTLWQTHELPFFIAVDTGKSADAIGNNGALQTGGTIWNSGMTIANSFNRLISINTKGGNGPWVYGGDNTGLNAVEMLDSKTSKIKMGYGKGILSKEVNGIDQAYGAGNGRVVGDVCNDSAAWVNFNTKGHDSNAYDFFYEMSIPLSELGITKADITANGVGVLVAATMGMSALDCLPYDTAMNDNADLPDTQSQENNSYEKSDADNITTKFAYIGKAGEGPVDPVKELELNFGADRSSPQEKATKLTLQGIAEGGKAPYTYEYYVNNKLVATQTGSGETSTSWVPTADEYVITCVVTDSDNNTVTSSKYYTIEGEREVCKHETIKVLNKKDSTCTEAGYTGDTCCAKCDTLVSKGSETPATDHKWDNGTVTKEATTTETGVKTYKCTANGCTETKTETIPKLTSSHEHVWGDGVVTTEPTEEKEGVLTYTCSGCKATKTEVIPKKIHVHTWGDGVVTTEPTEEKEGVLTYTCTGCTATTTEAIPKKTHVHTWGDGVVTKEATETTEGVLTYTCTGCTSTKEVAISKLTHTHEWDKGTITKVPTDTEAGEKTFKCTKNGCTATKVEPIFATPHEHTWVGKVTKEPTETEAGVLTYTCTGCTAITTETINKLDHVHTWGTGVITKQPTDTTLGVITYTCTGCSLTKTEEVTKPKHEHKWGTGVITKQPTATTEGELTYTCTECSLTKTEPLAKADHEHAWGEGVETKQPTETEEGVKTFKCTVAGCTATKTESVDKVAHKHAWNAGVVTKQPTATTKGSKTYTCTTCNATKTEEIPATGNGTTGGTTGGTTVTIPKEGEAFDDVTSKVTYRVTKDNANSKEVEYVIENSKAENVVIPATVTVGNVVYKVTSISDGAFKDNKYIKSVVIGENVKTIGESAFQKCKNLTSVTMGKNVTTIGNKAFYTCTALTNVKMSSKITKIGSQAFYKCTKLKSITIPSKVKSIGKKAFYGCKNLKKITIKTTKLTKKNVGSEAFKGINSKAKIKVPKKKLASYKKMLKAKGVSSKAKISK